MGGEHLLVLSSCESCGWAQREARCQERVRPMPLVGDPRRDRCALLIAEYTYCIETAKEKCVSGLPPECNPALSRLMGCP